MKWSTEAKVGAFTLAGLITLAVVIVQLTGLVLFGKPGYEIQGVFSEVRGLTQGNSVRYAGVEVGRVEEVRANPHSVDVRMRIYKDTRIPFDSDFSVESDGIIGEKFVSIVPGKSAGILAPGDTVYGSPPGGIDEVLRETKKLLTATQETMETVNKVLGDPSTQDSIRATIANAETISEQMLLLSSSVQKLTEQMQGILYRLDGDGKTTADIRSIAENMRVTSENTRHLSDKVRTLVSRPLFIPGEAELLYNATKGRASFNTNWDFGSNTSFTRIGAEDISDGTSLNFQYGRSNGPWTGRFGVIRGKPGVGVDYTRNKWKITADVYDLHDLQYRVRARWQAMPEWYLVGQTIQPLDSEHGGNYFGINHTF